MILRILLSTLTIILLGALNSNAQSTFYAVSPFDANLRIMDSTTMTATSTVPLTSATGTVTGANGLATFTCGPIYIVYKANASRYLGIIDPATGIIAEIGNLGDNVANIAFVNSVLYGVTGDGAAVGETLYTIDTVNAAMTLDQKFTALSLPSALSHAP